MPSAARRGLLSFLGEDEWFGQCGSTFQEALLRMGQEVALVEGAPLFFNGTADTALYCVVRGALVASNTDANGTVAVMSLIPPKRWFGESALFDGLPRTHDVYAWQDSTLLKIDGTQLGRWLDEHPANWKDLGRLTSGKLRVALSALEDATLAPLDVRILRRLQLIATGYRSRTSPQPDISISQEMLGQMMGVSRQSISKSLRQLEHRGLVTILYGRIILKGAALASG